MATEAPVFYFDLASPLAYLASERVIPVLGGAAEWQPVLARELPAGERFEAFRCAQEEEIFRAEIERRAREEGLLPVRWPSSFPFDSELAMRVATWAQSIGRTIAFAQAAFRQAFAGGHDLSVRDHVVVAAAACELHPAAVIGATERASVTEGLRRATAVAAERGVSDVPAVAVGGRVWVGVDAPEAAARR
jgi:2-hydroxychromene-2-carboxylate isomerase